LIGATLAALFLHAVINVSATYGSNYPAHGYSALAAFWMEFILTVGLVSVILGTASDTSLSRGSGAARSRAPR
jgi:aquaporin Z